MKLEIQQSNKLMWDVRGCSAAFKRSSQVHIFGHIHESYGDVVIGKTHFYNVCYLDEIYNPKNAPILIEL